MIITVKDNQIVLKGDYNDKDFCKSLGGRWDSSDYTWKLPLNLMNCYRVLDEGFEVEEITDFIAGFNKTADIKMPKLKYPLLKHQENVLKKIVANKRYGVFHDMGCGKTIVAIALSSYIYEQNNFCRTLVVCPLTIITPVWIRLIDEFCVYPYRIIKLIGSTNERLALLEKTKEFKDKINFIVTNYDGLRLVSEKLMEMNYEIIVCDESTRIKNKDAKCTKIITEITDNNKDYVICLTGTPFSNDVSDIYSQARAISKDIFGENYWKFADRYCIFGGYENHQIVGVKNKEELYEIINLFSDTVKKRDVLDLPEITYETREIELTGEQKKAYEEAEQQFQIICKAIKEGDKKPQEYEILIKNALSRITRLQQITSGHTKDITGDVIRFPENAKLEETLDIIRDSRPQPVVIFSRFVEDLRILNEEITKMGLISKIFYGDINIRERDQTIKDFQDGKVDIILVQNKTGGYGINLSRASIVIFYSLWWSYEVYDQDVSRIHRLGQKNNVLVIHLIAKSVSKLNTIDEDIYNIVQKKVKLSDYFFGEKLKDVKVEDYE
jgi:SNF2 family DNA or RNA helicase